MEELIIRISRPVLRVSSLMFGVVLLASAFFYFWSSGRFSSKYTLHAYIPDVAGLSLHSPVRLDGLRVGSVAAIRPAQQPTSPDRSIELVLQVDKRYQGLIRSDSTASVVREGLLGPYDFDIRRGFQGGAIAVNDEIRFVPTHEMTAKDVVDSLKKATDCNQAEKTSMLKTQDLPTTR